MGTGIVKAKPQQIDRSACSGCAVLFRSIPRSFLFVLVRALRFLADVHFPPSRHVPQRPGNCWRAISETIIDLRNREMCGHHEEQRPYYKRPNKTF
jgi:hypothetical protein